jgi:hypothetical protein
VGEPVIATMTQLAWRTAVNLFHLYERRMPQLFARALFIATTSFLAATSVASSQGQLADITVVSVLTMARAAADSEKPGHGSDILRARVAEAMKLLGLEDAFGDYAAKAHEKLRQNASVLPAERKKFEDAKHLFLSGNPQAAKERLGGVYCPGRKCVFLKDFALNSLFLHWEMDSGNLAAARDRLRATDWGTSQPFMAIQVARAYIAAGRQTEIPDLLSEINTRFFDADDRGLLAEGAALRKLVATGDAARAVEIANSEQNPRKRIGGLIIVAEALAGIPGLPDEPLSLY